MLGLKIQTFTNNTQNAASDQGLLFAMALQLIMAEYDIWSESRRFVTIPAILETLTSIEMVLFKCLDKYMYDK